MDTSELLPPLLKPLQGDCLVVEGTSAAGTVLAAVREALSQVDGFRTMRVRPGRAIYELKTREGEFVVKAFESRFMTRLSPLRFCQSGQEWKSIQHAHAKGIPTSSAIALVSGRGKPGANYLVLERVSGAADFELYLQRERERLAQDVKLLRGLIRSFARFVATLHKGGLIHHDLHLRNYIYVAMAFSFVIELLNMRIRQNAAPVQLHNQPTLQTTFAGTAPVTAAAPATQRRSTQRRRKAR